MTTIKTEKIIQAQPSEVYGYFTNSTALRDWMCDVATADPAPGGHLYMCWNDGYYTSGEYLKLEKDHSVSFTWLGKGEPRPTRVDVLLKNQKKGTLLKLTHRGIGKGKRWEGIAETYHKEWQSALDNLASILGEGPDLRISRRPMLGISVGDFNPEIAAKMEIPVEVGLRISGVVDGMGAQKAGLQADDVIVSVDGKDLVTNTTFGSIISTKHAGDRVVIEYYRDAKKNSTAMILSGRPIPPIPTTPDELRHQLEPTYREFEAKIEELIGQATDEQCNAKPAPEEWSVNEVIAHLIHSELGWENAMSEIIGGYEGSYDGYGGNVQAQIEGTVATYQTKSELFRQLKNHHTETLNIISHIPEEFLQHKGKFWKLVFQASQNPYHMQAHLEQIQKAIMAAKNR